MGVIIKTQQANMLGMMASILVAYFYFCQRGVVKMTHSNAGEAACWVVGFGGANDACQHISRDAP
jgi:hypothetical protein